MSRKYPPSVGGMEKFAFDLSAALARNNQISLKKIVWGGSNKLLPVIVPLHFMRSFWYLLTHPGTDIIHSQDGVMSPVAWLLSCIFRKPYVVVVHGQDITYPLFLYQELVLPFIRKANYTVCISGATQDEARARGVLSSRSSIITPGTHDPYGSVKKDRKRLNRLLDLRQDDKRPLVLTTGRLVPRKGVAWFIEWVLPGLIDQYPDILYLVVGEGEHQKVIDEAIKANGLSKNVRLLGRVDDDTRAVLYQSSDIFVMPNIVIKGDMEGFGIVAHEAAIAELPVVASGIEGIKDALHDGKNGILLPAGDASAYEKTIKKIIEDKDFQKSFGQKARRYTLDNFTWDEIAKNYLRVYKKVLKS